MKMDDRTFIGLIENPKGIDEASLEKLLKVTEKYPYFSLAKLVYLKGLKVNGDARYSTMLSHISTYAPSGEWLYLYLSDYDIGVQSSYIDQDDAIEEQVEYASSLEAAHECFSYPNEVNVASVEEPYPVAEPDVEVAEVDHLASAELVEEAFVATDVEVDEVVSPADVPVVDDAPSLYDGALVEAPLANAEYVAEEEDDEIPIEPSLEAEEHEAAADVSSSEVREEAAEAVVEEKAPDLVFASAGFYPMEAEPSAKASEEEPFELIDDDLSSEDDPIFEILDQKLYTLDDSEKNIEMQYSLIDQFLSANPRIVPKPDLPPVNEDISVQSLEDDGELVTESLAQVYAAQGLVDKAEDIYQKLCLKFPEKKAYFVAQLQKLKESK